MHMSGAGEREERIDRDGEDVLAGLARDAHGHGRGDVWGTRDAERWAGVRWGADFDLRRGEYRQSLRAVEYLLSASQSEQ